MAVLRCEEITWFWYMDKMYGITIIIITTTNDSIATTFIAITHLFDLNDDNTLQFDYMGL